MFNIRLHSLRGIEPGVGQHPNIFTDLLFQLHASKYQDDQQVTRYIMEWFPIEFSEYAVRYIESPLLRGVAVAIKI